MLMLLDQLLSSSIKCDVLSKSYFPIVALLKLP
uniref:Uncharacterized protein n=1 Tax=Arundo donax TaxID=35708 RepID=A0A0A9BCB5_ARUDO